MATPNVKTEIFKQRNLERKQKLESDIAAANALSGVQKAATKNDINNELLFELAQANNDSAYITRLLKEYNIIDLNSDRRRKDFAGFGYTQTSFPFDGGYVNVDLSYVLSSPFQRIISVFDTDTKQPSDLSSYSTSGQFEVKTTYNGTVIESLSFTGSSTGGTIYVTGNDIVIDVPAGLSSVTAGAYVYEITLTGSAGTRKTVRGNFIVES